MTTTSTDTSTSIGPGRQLPTLSHPLTSSRNSSSSAASTIPRLPLHVGVCAFSDPWSPVVPLSSRTSLLPPHPRRLSLRHGLTTLLCSPDHPACTTARSWPVRRNTPSRATQSLKQWAADNLRLESSQSSRQSTLGAARCSSARFTLNLTLAANLTLGSVASKLDRQQTFPWHNAFPSAPWH